jgi:hypothetical protein
MVRREPRQQVERLSLARIGPIPQCCAAKLSARSVFLVHPDAPGHTGFDRPRR